MTYEVFRSGSRWTRFKLPWLLTSLPMLCASGGVSSSEGQKRYGLQQDTRTKAIVNRFAVAVHSARTLRAITFLPPDRLDLSYSLNSRWDSANNC